MVKHVHIVGAGLAGLSAALEARARGLNCTIYEATHNAGGRIRQIGTHDNGTHLIVKGYQDTFEFLQRVGTTDVLSPLEGGAFHFSEPASQLNWSLKAHHFVWQVAKGSITGVNATNILGETAMKRLWRPFFLAVFNTDFEDVPAKMRREMFWEMLKQGPSALTPYFCKTTLAQAFINPALPLFDIRFGKRLTGLEHKRLIFKEGEVLLSKNEAVILALPGQAYHQINSPFDFAHLRFNPISNIHFQLDSDVTERFIGLIGTQSQWLYAKNKQACVTISNQKIESVEQVKQIWAEVCSFLGCNDTTLPVYRVICEKQATPAQNRDFATHRPCCRTHLPHIFLAGDWIDTGLPVTIESAIRSGKMAVNELIENKR